MANKTAKAIDKTIQKNLSRLSKPGVLTVRPGFEIAGHRLTGKAAIVATVHTKKKSCQRVTNFRTRFRAFRSTSARPDRFNAFAHTIGRQLRSRKWSRAPRTKSLRGHSNDRSQAASYYRTFGR